MIGVVPAGAASFVNSSLSRDAGCTLFVRVETSCLLCWYDYMLIRALRSECSYVFVRGVLYMPLSFSIVVNMGSKKPIEADMLTVSKVTKMPRTSAMTRDTRLYCLVIKVLYWVCASGPTNFWRGATCSCLPTFWAMS